MNQMNRSMIAEEKKPNRVKQEQPAVQRAAAEQTDGSMTEINLADLFRALKKHLILILLATILGGAIAGAYTHFFVTPKYKAKSVIYLVSTSNSVLNLSDLQLTAGITEDYAALIKSRTVMLTVAENMNLDYSYTQMCGIVSVENPANTHMLNVYATCENPTLAKEIADETAKVSIEKIGEVMEISKPNVIDKAVVPSAPDSPSLSKNALIGALLGMLLVVMVITLRVVFDRTIRSTEDIEKYCGLVTLAKVYDTKESAGGYGTYYGRYGSTGKHKDGKKPVSQKKR